jgi:membrane-associated phospholipid phosphatase
MNSILEWGICVIAAIQTARTPVLDEFFKGMSALGSEYFYFAALPFICTMVNRTIGIRIALTILVSVTLNSLIKHWVGEPRPFELDPSVMVVGETGYGFPSGHAQQAALFWGLAVLYIRKLWVTVVAAIFVGLVGLSRIYLGVHYPTDVLGSLVIAGFILFNYQMLVKYGHNLWRASTRIPVTGLVIAIAVLASTISPMKDMISGTALGAGLVAGLLVSPTIPPLSTSIRRRFMLAAFTAIVLFLVFIGLKYIFPKNGETNYEVFSFVRYFACGFVLNAFPLLMEKWE